MDVKINEKRLFKTFKDLASISSPSWKEKEVIDYIAAWCKNEKIRIKKIKCGSSYNLLINIKANKKRSPSILFSAHTDTVVPCEKIKVIETDTRFQSDGKTILGADDKSGIAACMEAIKTIKESAVEHGPIELLFTCAEEVGLLGAKKMDFSQLNSKIGFVLDSHGPIGSACIKAPYHSTMEITIKGKPAHAGIEPEKGFSAIYAAAEIISKLPKGKIDKETTTNVGTINGGQANNIVAAETVFTLECRSLNKEKLSKLDKKIKDTIKKICASKKVKFKIDYNLEYKGFTIKPESKTIKLFEKACEKCKIKPVYEASGGGSDTNIINANRIQALNISCGMSKVHTTQEFLNKKDLVKITNLVTSLILNI